MIANTVTHKPITNVACPACAKATPQRRGVLFRVDLSRLEEGLGHEGFQCDKCGHTVKYVPKDK
jgi:hypothetical protein